MMTRSRQLSVAQPFSPVTRRSFLGRASIGLGAIALAAMSRELHAAKADHLPALPPGVDGFPNFAPRVKRVIFLCMSGGPSQFETFDEKPKLRELHGQLMPASVTAGQPIAQLQGQKLVVQQPMFRFRRFGQSGQNITELFPHIGSIADDICIVRSMHTDQINHDPAHTVMNTGTSISGRPSMGAWITYGLGSDSQDLPGFIVLTSQGGRSPQPLSARIWHSGFLPGRYQGVQFNSQGDAVYYVRSPAGVAAAQQRQVIDAVAQLNQLRNAEVHDAEIDTRVAQYEMAFRMQASVPQLMDISAEPQSIRDAYGVKEADGSFGYNCLLARRLAERGVRFIQLFHRGWDHHDHLDKYMRISSKLVDQGTAALVTDLKQRGMFDDTLIVWSGEFGRTPMAQSNKGDTGRDHHIRAFSLFLAGGGVRGGLCYGSTDELGYHAAENPVHVHDLHATMLHQLGIDHTRLTYRYQGRDFRLTDVAGRVVKEILT
jgi:uncharacterized protein (DUF1501 family)